MKKVTLRVDTRKSCFLDISVRFMDIMCYSCMYDTIIYWYDSCGSCRFEVIQM